MSSSSSFEWPSELGHIIIITMGNRRRLERLVHVLGPLLELCHVLPAVEGGALSLKELKAAGQYKPVDKWNELTPGQVGCFMSHRLAWKYIIEHNLSSVLVLEDDATTDFADEKVASLMRVIMKLREASGQWSVLYLGRNNRMITDRKRFNADIVSPGRSWGLFAYAVSLEGARKLCKQSRVITEAVDIFVSTTPMSGRFAITPNVFDVHDDGISDTQQRRVKAPARSRDLPSAQTQSFSIY
jgi:glycosyl transferase family 25